LALVARQDIRFSHAEKLTANLCLSGTTVLQAAPPAFYVTVVCRPGPDAPATINCTATPDRTRLRCTDQLHRLQPASNPL